MTSRLLPRSSFVLGLTLVLAACSGHPEYSTDDRAADLAVAASGVAVDVVATNSWNGGFNGAVRITDNAFNVPITSFQIVFKLGGNAAVVGTAYNGSISRPDASGNFTATN